MSASHAAALAFVSWYLVVAPNTGVIYDGVERDAAAPVADWEVQGNYESMYDCGEDAITLFIREKGLWKIVNKHSATATAARSGYDLRLRCSLPRQTE